MCVAHVARCEAVVVVCKSPQGAQDASLCRHAAAAVAPVLGTGSVSWGDTGRQVWPPSGLQ